MIRLPFRAVTWLRSKYFECETPIGTYKIYLYTNHVEWYLNVSVTPTDDPERLTAKDVDQAIADCTKHFFETYQKIHTFIQSLMKRTI